MLQLTNINVRNVLVDLNLAVKKNEFVLVMGDNGAGKTTLFNTISGHIIPKSGSVEIDGEDVTDVPQYERASIVSNVLQDPKVGTIASMSVRENLNIAYMRGKKRGVAISDSLSRDALYVEKLSALNMGIEKRLDEYVGNLSGGQRQALSMVTSIVANSKILLLDEITAALDAKTSETILKIAAETVRREKKTCLMITHNLKHINCIGDRALRLKDGNLKPLHV
jgi:putative ABC transport system ATP-binding protein